MPAPYRVNRIETGSLAKIDWNDPVWQRAEKISVDHFHPKSSDHHPRTQACLLYDQTHLFLAFEVHDRYVLSKATEYQQSVCLDSCVEFFVQPKTDLGYFNFEINCGGTLLLYYIDFPGKILVSAQSAAKIAIYHSMPPVTMPERPEPITWRISARIPFSLFEEFVGPVTPVSGSQWRANFYKCADHSSHPHWASWAPIGELLSFHQPKYFGQIQFA